MPEPKDLSPKLKIPTSEQELSLPMGVAVMAPRQGGLSLFSTKFKRGYGNEIFGSDENGIWLGSADFDGAPFSVDMDGNLIATSATITGVGQNFVSTLTWTATDQDTGTWSSGTIKTSDGTSYSISGGNTGNITVKTYVYLDPATSTTVLQTSTTATDAAGNGIILIATVEKGAAGSESLINVSNGTGTTIDGTGIVTDAVTATQINVANLAAINANMGTLTAGSITASSLIEIGGVHMVGDGIAVDNAKNISFDNTSNDLKGFVSYASDNIFKLGTVSGGNKVYLVSNANVAVEISTDGTVTFFNDIDVEDDINPNSDNSTSSLGFASRYFHQVYANFVRYKDLDSFQDHDDIGMVKAIKKKTIKVRGPSKLNSKGEKVRGKLIEKGVWDETTVPDEIYDDGFFDAGAVSGLAIGTLKQVIARLEEAESEIAELRSFLNI